MMTSNLSAHQEAVRRAVCDGLPSEPLVSGFDLARIRVSFRERLRAIAADLPPDSIRVNRAAGPKALACPASSESDFEWKAMFASRSLGLPVVAQIRERPNLGATTGVRARIEDEIARQSNLGKWLEGLDAAGRSAVLASAVTWVGKVCVAVPWASFESVRFPAQQAWHRPLGYNTSVVLNGRYDAAVEFRKPKAAERVIISIGRHSSESERVDLLAVCLEGNGRIPLRSVTVDTATGATTVTSVTTEFLEIAVDDVERIATLLAPKGRGEHLVTVPGPQCWWCDHRSECTTGLSWMASQPRRRGGIPLSSK